MMGIELAFGVLGLGVGALVVWLYLRTTMRSEMAVLEERVSSKEQQLRTAWADMDAIKTEFGKLQTLARNEQSMRLAAEQTCQRIPGLEKQIALKEQQIAQLMTEMSQLKAQLAEQSAKLAEGQSHVDEKIALLQEAKDQLADQFKMISAETLRSSSESFLGLAKSELERIQREAAVHLQAQQQTLASDIEARQKAVNEIVRPLKESLDKVENHVRELEGKRMSAYASLTQQISSLVQSQETLQGETSNLARALRVSTPRGRWGEIQLKRVVEMAGMVQYCDFQRYPNGHAPSDDDWQKPDLIVRLPGGRSIAVDAKAPMQPFLESIETQSEETRLNRLKEHATKLREHVTRLSERSYWDQFRPMPEFVVLFLPGETIYSAALEQDPDLIEYGVDKKVIIATPTTLISLLRSVAYGWRQEQVEENAQRISALGKELAGHVRMLTERFTAVGRSLTTTIHAYNEAVGTLDGRVLVSARKFAELGADSGEEIPGIEPLAEIPRPYSAEIVELPSGSNGSGERYETDGSAALARDGE